MCRKNRLWGFLMLGFGLGLLFGRCFESVLICLFCGVGIITVGCGLLRKN